MDITPVIAADRQVIDSYGPGFFRIAGIVHNGPVLVFPDRTLPWSVSDFAELQFADFQPLIDATPKIEVLLLGAGARMALLPSALRRTLRDAGLVVDVMDSGAACRTYAVLLAEARRVAAALLPV
jgi:uncharacterized protein